MQQNQSGVSDVGSESHEGVITSVVEVKASSLKPLWFYDAINTLEYDESDTTSIVYVSNGGVRLKISLYSRDVDEKIHTLKTDEWLVKYTIDHGSRSGKTEVSRVFTMEELHSAFGSRIIMPSSHVPFLARMHPRIDLFVPGKFVRSGHYLNIPGFGSGVACDANLSISLDPEKSDIQDRVCMLTGYRFE